MLPASTTQKAAASQPALHLSMSRICSSLRSTAASVLRRPATSAAQPSTSSWRRSSSCLRARARCAAAATHAHLCTHTAAHGACASIEPRLHRQVHSCTLQRARCAASQHALQQSRSAARTCWRPAGAPRAPPARQCACRPPPWWQRAGCPGLQAPPRATAPAAHQRAHARAWARALCECAHLQRARVCMNRPAAPAAPPHLLPEAPHVVISLGL